MNDKSFTAVLGVIVPEIVHRITENYSCDEVTATEKFYFKGLCTLGAGGNQDVAFQPVNSL